MGYCCFSRCFNTPHAQQLGWISVQQLAALSAGESTTMQLPSQSLSADGAGLQVTPSWAPGAAPLWLGYRTKSGGDAQLLDTFAGKLNAYTLQPPSGYTGSRATLFLAAIPGEVGGCQRLGWHG